MGVKLLLDTRVTDYRDGAIVLANGESIPTETVIWVSGVTARLFEGIPEAVTGKGGRILTDEFCRVKNQSNIFAIGDIAQQNEPAYPNGHPQDLPHLKTQGFVAWFLWMAVHLRSILGVRNRLEILLNWFWNYLTYDQAIRLIFKTKRTPPDDTDSSS